MSNSPGRNVAFVWLLLLAVALPSAMLAAPPDTQESETSVASVDKRLYTPRNRAARRVRTPLTEVSRSVTERKPQAGFEDAIYEYVRFQAIPDWSQRRALQRRGVLLTSYAGDNTYVAAINEMGQAFLREAPDMTRMGPVGAASKIERDLLDGNVHAWAKDHNGSVLVRVQFQESVPLELARVVLESHGATVLDELTYPNLYMLEASLDQSLIPLLARSGRVRSISMPMAKHISHNEQAADIVGVDVLQQLPFNLSGAGYTAGIWDLGLVYGSAEFSGRLFYGDIGVPFNEHATHVAGTIGAAGNLGFTASEQARGMADQVVLVSYDSADWVDEFINEMFGGNMPVLGNSWGQQIGWEWLPECDQSDGCLPPQPAQWGFFGNSNLFGAYTVDSANIDNITDFAEESGDLFLVVASAGNHRDEPGPGQPHDGIQIPTPGENIDYAFYDTIGPLGTAKNALTVGSVTDHGEMTIYSGWGPVDTGRIKPDLVAPGDGLHSTWTDTAYSVQAGSSMAAAVVSGTAILLLELFENTFATQPTNAELKALLINSTQDLGQPGPDYVYGYGRLNAEVAAATIQTEGDTSTIVNGELDQNGIDTYMLEVIPGTPDIKCTLAWFDDFDTFLVNNMDLRLISPSNQIFYPFSLTAGNPVQPATATGPNTVDTVEQIVVENPETGTWIAEVKGTSVPTGPQRYGLVSKVGLSAPSIFDFLPPQGVDPFPYPYRRPILVANYVDPGGAGIDASSVITRINSFNQTSFSVISEGGVYLPVAFDLWLDTFLFKVDVSNNNAVTSSGLLYFNIVDANTVELEVTPGATGEVILDWGPPSFDGNFLLFNGYRVYRSTDLQTELELIHDGFTSTFTDFNPPPGNVFYEVHVRYEGGVGNRILSTRATPFRTRQPVLATPQHQAPFEAGITVVRFRGMSEPGSDVTIWVDGAPLTTVTALADGSFTYVHDFDGPGVHSAYVQAKTAGKSLSVPTMEADFELLP